MKTIRKAGLAFASLLFFAISGGAASAQATRTWVSGVGDDANPCSRTAPCKTFAGAISKTAAGGEISVLDPGGFGAVTITKSISIVADGSEGSILSPQTNGIVINAGANDTVHISGLKLEGAGQGVNGIRVLSAGNVYITNTQVRGYITGTAPAGRGISLENSAAASRVYLRNVEITNNNVGVYVHAGATPGVVLLDDSVVEGNKSNSLYLDTSNSSVAASKSNILTPVFLSNGAQFISTGNNFIQGAVGPTVTIPLR
ncbi:hypothetical protein HNR00_002908 [Methylorubrum rhodinum]|uniref:Right handed beta helix domain-containing protein n=1 Tax=Methylorubrum rhodinum TaxID=29428 RepID=A0A840ZLK0_9HYPH|nr:hypothetical protein [Methylorubrum rhodinum]MBB5758190.1 hypothetical protein [Methylorubrum rhodinum]